jgi:hypothetical protein
MFFSFAAVVAVTHLAQRISHRRTPGTAALHRLPQSVQNLARADAAGIEPFEIVNESENKRQARQS